MRRAPPLGLGVRVTLPCGWNNADVPDDPVNGKFCSLCGPVNSSSLVRFLPVSQYLLELASGVWVLECGVLTSREA